VLPWPVGLVLVPTALARDVRPAALLPRRTTNKFWHDRQRPAQLPDRPFQARPQRDLTDRPPWCHKSLMRTAWAMVAMLVIGCGGATVSGSSEQAEATGGRTEGVTDGESRVPPAGGSRGSTDLARTGGTRALESSSVLTGGTRASGGSSTTLRSAQSEGGTPTTSVGGRTNVGGSMTAGGRSTAFAGGGSSSGGTTANRSVAGSHSQAGAIDPCSLPGAHCTSIPWPECAQLGGACVRVSSSSGQCPTGSYNAFSANIYCPAAFIGRCCVPE
jgi:hypothetical protein